MALTLRAYADDQGIHISKRLVDAQIAQIPAFQDAAGNFSNDNFRALLARERLSEQALRDDISREILQRQLLAPIGIGARPSENLVLPYASLLLEARQGQVAAIPAVAALLRDQRRGGFVTHRAHLPCEQSRIAMLM